MLRDPLGGAISTGVAPAAWCMGPGRIQDTSRVCATGGSSADGHISPHSLCFRRLWEAWLRQPSAWLGTVLRLPAGRMSLSISVGLLFLGFLLNLVGGLLVLLSDVVELLHVLEELVAPAQRDEELGLLAVAAVARGLHSNGLRADLLESGVLVSTDTRY